MDQLLFSVLLILLPTQLGLHFWPDWTLVLGRRVDYLSPTLYLTDIVLFLLFVVWFITKPKIRHLPFIKILLCLGFIILNIIFATNRLVAFYAWIKVLEYAALGLYIIQTKQKLTTLILPLSIGVLFSSVIAMIQFILQHSIGGLFWLLGERTFSAMTPGIAQIALCFPKTVNCPLVLRSYATFSHPNVLGGYLSVLLPLLIFVFMFATENITNIKKIFFISTILLGITALILSFSRSAWVVFAISILYLVFKKSKRIFYPLLVLIFILIFFIGKTFGLQDESVVVREQLNSAAISMTRASPIIGTGLGNYLIRLPRFLVTRTVYFLQPVHNMYLLVLSETGIIGFSLFLWIVWKAIHRNIYIIPFLLLGLVDHYFLTLQQGQLLFTVFLSLSLIQ